MDQDALSFVVAWFREHPLVEFLKKPLIDIHEIFCSSVYIVLPKNSGNLNRAPEPVVVCPSAARCGWQYAL